MTSKRTPNLTPKTGMVSDQRGKGLLRIIILLDIVKKPHSITLAPVWVKLVYFNATR